MIINIFYSWQSDLPSISNKNYIEKMIKKSISNLEKEDSIIAIVDRDTKGKTGSPNIFETILSKIDKCKFFICDVSIVSENNKPNPNVLIELGYAIKTLGWDRIICLFNVESGKIEDLPFNINHNRITPYRYDTNNEINRISSIISNTIKKLHKDGRLFDPVEDYVKGKIDYIFISILQNLDMVISLDKKSTDKIQSFAKLLDITTELLTKQLQEKEFLGFYFVQSYDQYIEKLERLLDRLYLTKVFNEEASRIVINMIEWIDSYETLISQRFHKELIIKKRPSELKVVQMEKVNKSNNDDSVILLKPIDNEKGIVIKGGIIKQYNLIYSDQFISLNPVHIESVVSCLMSFIKIVNQWMELTGNEFILDPKYFKIY